MILNHKSHLKKTWNDKCAVFGIWNDPESAYMSYLGLYAQQHRGQEGAGIVSLYKGQHIIHRGMGLVGDVFNPKALKRLKGLSAIGHTRYSTQGGDKKKNIQPLTAILATGPLAVSHNGNILNFPQLKKELMDKGSIFYSSSDTECLIHLLAGECRKTKQSTLPQYLIRVLPLLEGAYSMALLTQDSLIAVRDPMGFRPLVLGQRTWEDKKGQEKKSYVIASETCAFDLIGAKQIREIEPGEIWTINKEGESSYFLKKREDLYRCIFEHVYFARPDSEVFGQNVYECRKEMGRILAQESPAQADIVIPVPDSGVPSALGYSEQSGLPYDMGIVRNHYIGRTFIHPSQSIRNFKVKIKLSVQKKLIKGKKVLVVDDSLVRGTTSKAVVHLLKSAGAGEIHFRVSSPPITGPCFYGVDTPEKKDLIASKKSVKEIKQYLQVDSLAFLSLQGLMRATKGRQEGPPRLTKPLSTRDKESSPLGAKYSQNFCSACFTGSYPTAIPLDS